MNKELNKLALVAPIAKRGKPVQPPHDPSLRLADFIAENSNAIIEEWERFARTLTPVESDKTPLALRDHIKQILAFIVGDMKSAQTGAEQIQKSHGEKEKDPTPSAAETHAALRLAGGFNIDQMVSEYRSLRASVIKLWSVPNKEMQKLDIIDLTRFNESIDQELAESVSHYTQKVVYSKDLFVGILSHELRNPLNVISMSAQLIMNIGTKAGTVNERQSMLAAQIYESTTRIAKIVDELLDLTRARFGSGFAIIRTPMDMVFVGRQLVDEMRANHPSRKVVFSCTGALKGEWDKARISQVFSNLIGNAIQYSFVDSVINVTIEGTTDEIILTVQNDGVPIPPEKIATLFESLTRAVTDAGHHPEAVNLGLGLYITKEIVTAHGGTIAVSSTEEAGTIFTVRLPRFAEVVS